MGLSAQISYAKVCLDRSANLTAVCRIDDVGCATSGRQPFASANSQVAVGINVPAHIKRNACPAPKAPNIIANPPYNAAEGFAQAGLEKASKKFALLLRLAFLEGANRQRTIFTNAPPSRV